MAKNAQKQGFQFENDLAAAIYDRSDLVPMRIGYSDNDRVPGADVVIDDGEKVHAFELKRITKDRYSFSYDQDEPDDIHDLVSFAKQYPRPVPTYLGIKFTNRQLILAKLWSEGPLGPEMIETAVTTCPVPSKRTRADNFSVPKPSLDEWVSERSGDNVQYLLETIGYC